jgi:hypothetical protein
MALSAFQTRLRVHFANTFITCSPKISLITVSKDGVKYGHIRTAVYQHNAYKYQASMIRWLTMTQATKSLSKATYAS